jgi:hypothetical protein
MKRPSGSVGVLRSAKRLRRIARIRDGILYADPGRLKTRFVQVPRAVAAASRFRQLVAVARARG